MAPARTRVDGSAPHGLSTAAHGGTIDIPPAATPMEPTDKPADPAPLEISLPSALELCRLGLATMIDIRQAFEIQMKGAIPGTVHIPLFEVKRLLGQALTEDEQDTLDAGEPTPIDVQGFITMINRLHHARDHVVLCVCNSGKRSVGAAQLLRSLGYPKALSVVGGFQAWKKLQTAEPPGPAGGG